MLTVHWKVLVPTLKPVTVEVGEEGVVIVPVPAISVQSPVPTVGVLAANADEVMLHKF